MKRLTAFIISFMMLLSFVFSQGAKETSPIQSSPFSDKVVDVNVVALKGPTAMGMVELMDKAENGAVDGNKYTFQLESAPDAVVPLIVKGDADIAAIPANLAAVVYNNTSKIEILAINTLGVLYICQNGGEKISTIEDLRGKTIYSSGKGSTPQFALEAVLSRSGLEVGKDVFIEWKSEHAECVASLIASGDDSSKVAMLPQPFATTAIMSNPSISIAIDLNEAWQDIAGSPLVTGVTVVNKEFAKANPEAVDAFLSSYKESVDYTHMDVDGAAKLVAKYSILPKEAVAKKALPECNIVLLTGDDMKKALKEYFSVLYSFNPASVGGKLPGDEIYY